MKFLRFGTVDPFLFELDVVFHVERESARGFVAVDRRVKKARSRVNTVVSNQNRHGTHPSRNVIGPFAL